MFQPFKKIGSFIPDTMYDPQMKRMEKLKEEDAYLPTDDSSGDSLPQSLTSSPVPSKAARDHSLN